MAKASSTSKKAAKSAETAATLGVDSRLQEFFCEELKDIYWAENHIAQSLPKMKKSATTPELQTAFEDHLQATLAEEKETDVLLTQIAENNINYEAAEE